jgi:pyruvate formate-lyase activating enzyme-like uncharacterized protein
MVQADYQDIMAEKIKRQNKLIEMGAERDALGHCFHYGKISAGCRKCFTNENGSGIQVGAKCMCNCPYCYYSVNRLDESKESIDTKLANWFLQSQNLDYKATIFSYQSTGETMMYLDELRKFALIINGIADRNNINHYIFLYTNGLLCNEENLKILKEELRVNEIRFHLSASQFSKAVWKNMETAKDMGFIITVEEPAWINNKNLLMMSLKRFNDIGLDHLDIVETQITDDNVESIKESYPDDNVKYYRDYFYHLYDNGMVYDIMENVIVNKFKYSVLDCNSSVEHFRQNRGYDFAHMNSQLIPESEINKMCREYKYIK